MLTGTPLQIGVSAPPDPAQALAQAQAAAVNSVNLLPVAPFPLDQTFLLHSLPNWQTRTDVKTIYLDFDGFITRDTAWNSATLPNIVTPEYSLDGDFSSFSDDEKLLIQSVWEHASEDFRPFDVDVTTQDPGVEALRNTGGADQQWGKRVVIGGSTFDWFTPTDGRVVGGVAFLTSFSWDVDTPAFVFGQDYGGAAYDIAETVSHETGHTLGLNHDGLNWYWQDSGDMSIHSAHEEYYAGHPGVVPPLPTTWAPIMGVGYGKPLTQWSFGEYPGADNIEDDLLIITSDNGFGYRPDDHGDSRATATPLDVDPLTSTADVDTFVGEGIIGQHPAAGLSDVDYFSFTVDGVGANFSFDISPFQTGPNLDILAKLVDSSGHVFATSNPRDYLAAGSQTLDPTDYPFIDPNDPNFQDPNLGWRVQFDSAGLIVLNPSANGTWQNVSDLTLLPGTYYLTVEGTGKPLTYIDPAVHPLVVDPPGAPDNPSLPTDLSDWGYSNYGSLGYYSITGTRKKGLVVGVDFDVPGGVAPSHWNLFTGSSGPTGMLTGLISEAGGAVPYTLSISTTGPSINTFASDNPIDSSDLPDHFIPLDELKGFISAENETTTFTWGNLEPWSYHRIYVFGHSDFDARNAVTITGGNLNGTVQTISFNQTISPDSLMVNNGPSSNADLSTFAYSVLSDGLGQISIAVTNAPGFEFAIAGLAIMNTRPIGPAENGSISGQKWDDGGVGVDNVGAGNRIKNSGEAGLEGWIIYIDEDNNGVLNTETTDGEPDQTLTIASTNVPQSIPDESNTGVKSSLDVAALGTVQDINVSFDITHTYDSDLNVVLISPSGTRVKLVTRRGSDGVNFVNTVIDDSASVAIGSASAPFTGTFRPEEPLSILNGEDATGTWQLEIKDLALGDVGTLTSWSITVDIKGTPGTTKFTEPYRITDVDGNYSFDDLAPGLYNIREYISPEQEAAGWKQTWGPPPRTLTSGAAIFNHDFGNWIPLVQRGSIQGQKYFDSNQDGVKDVNDPGLPGWIVYIDQNNNGIRDISADATVVTSTDVPKPIVDLQTTNSQMTVGPLGSVFNVEVTLDISHTYMGDLDTYLTSPSGRRVLLFSGDGGEYNDFHNLTLSDSATRSIDSIGFNDLPYTGTWKPEGFLSDFGGDDAAGIWTLSITDAVGADEGILNSWSLRFGSGELYRTTDADGNYQFDNIDAGNYVVREEPQPGWTQIPPADTGIPGATWNNGHWDVTVVAIDDPTDPDGADSKRNVKNVDFWNVAPLGSISGYVYRDLDASATKAASEPGLSGWKVFIDADNDGTLDLGSVDTVVSLDAAKEINNFFTVSSKLWVGAMTSISDIDLSLDITHTYDGDLTAYLISPSGTRVKLFSNVGTSGHDFQGTTLDDNALIPITSGTAPFTDAYKPAEPLSAFNGQNAAGYWTLEIKDSVAANDGFLNSWSLKIKGDELSTTTDAQGQYSFGNLPPGTYNLDVVQAPGWTKSEDAGAVALLASQALLTANFGERPPFLAGDFNSDGVVDSADFLVWRRQTGATVPNFSGADGDGDGDVDQADFTIWRLNFGHYLDDHGNNFQSATSAALPASIGGKIEVAGDVDWFSFAATGGTLYKIQSTQGTLDAASLQLFSSNGTTQLATNSGASPIINWTAPADGIYFAQVKSQSGLSVGTYTATIAAVNIDDHGNNAASSTLVATPSSTAGILETVNDVDWFKFTATSGTAYVITTIPGTLIYSQIRVIGTDGVTALQSNAGFSPSLSWTPSASGTYYIEVAGFATTGSYSLAVAVDDHGNNAAGATPYVVPSTAAGNIEGPYDVDWFSFSANSGVQYTFYTTLATLSDSKLYLLDTNGTTQLAYDDDGGGGLSSLISWTAPASGTYFVEVTGFAAASGTYTLSSTVTPGAGSGSSTLLAPGGELSDLSPASGADVSAPAVSYAAAQGTAVGSVRNIAKSASQGTAESSVQNDLALLAWLANSSSSNRSSSDMSPDDDDFSASRVSDEPETMDVAFELLEGNALVSAAI